MTPNKELTDSPEGKMVSPFFVPVIGLMFGFVGAWLFAVIWMIAAVVIYGFTGLDLMPPSFRIVAFVFSSIFVSVALFGWYSLVHAFLSRHDAERKG